MTTNKTPWLLVVDDDPVLCRALERSLIGRGFVVFSTTSPTAALSMVSQTGRIDAVITDHDMPEMTGSALLDVIQTVMGRVAPPVIVVSGRAEVLSIPAAAVVVQKPFDMDDLVEHLRSMGIEVKT